MINTIGAFVFYGLMAYIAVVVAIALFGLVMAIFVPSSRTYSKRGSRIRDNNSDRTNDFFPIFWDSSSHDHCDNSGYDND